MKSYKQYLAEMAPPTNFVRNKDYYHGTNKIENIKSIIKNGLIPPDLKDRKGFLRPVEGKVYITPDLKYAVIYVIGGNMIGYDFRNKIKEEKETRYGYLIVVDGNELKDVQPDEDEIGDLFYNNKAPSWLNYLANKHIAYSTMKKVKDGEYSYFAKMGKVLVNKMTDSEKLELVGMGLHIAHGGKLDYKEIWKFDKMKNHLLEKDCSNFFELAKRIK